MIDRILDLVERAVAAYEKSVERPQWLRLDQPPCPSSTQEPVEPEITVTTTLGPDPAQPAEPESPPAAGEPPVSEETVTRQLAPVELTVTTTDPIDLMDLKTVQAEIDALPDDEITRKPREKLPTLQKRLREYRQARAAITTPQPQAGPETSADTTQEFPSLEEMRKVMTSVMAGIEKKNGGGDAARKAASKVIAQVVYDQTGEMRSSEVKPELRQKVMDACKEAK